MISIDGSYGEGGGQIVRNALAFSTITGKAFEIKNIRKGRKKPGLKTQHIYSIRALKELTGASISGDQPGSLELTCYPSLIKGKDLLITMGTAGSITLLLQSLLLPCLFSKCKINIFLTGGTDVRWSMPFDYFKEVFLPYLNMFGNFQASLLKRGYYPRGGGEVKIEITPPGITSIKELRERFSPIKLLSQGELTEVRGIVNVTPELEKRYIGKRIRNAACEIFNKEKYSFDVKIDNSSSSSSGCGIVLWGKFNSFHTYPVIIGADKMGERGVTSEQVGKKAARKLIKRIQTGAPVDEHLGDNLLPLIALVGGEMKVEKISCHILSGIYVIEEFMGKIFDIDEENNIINANFSSNLIYFSLIV